MSPSRITTFIAFLVWLILCFISVVLSPDWPIFVPKWVHKYNKLPSSLLPVRLFFFFVLCMVLRELTGMIDNTEFQSRPPTNRGSVSGFYYTIQTADKAHTVCCQDSFERILKRSGHKAGYLQPSLVARVKNDGVLKWEKLYFLSPVFSTPCTEQIYLHGVKSNVWMMPRGASTRKCNKLLRSRVKLRRSQYFRRDAPTLR